MLRTLLDGLYRLSGYLAGAFLIVIFVLMMGTGLVILAIAFLDELVHVARGGTPRYEKPPATTAEEVVERSIQSGV
jgi:hypothetical protein